MAPLLERPSTPAFVAPCLLRPASTTTSPTRLTTLIRRHHLPHLLPRRPHPASFYRMSVSGDLQDDDVSADPMDEGAADDDFPSDTYVPAAEASTSSPSTLQSTQSKRAALISRLLQLCAATNRGQDATSSQTNAINELVTSLEEINPTSQPVNTDMLDGLWTLVYTSATLLQSSKTIDLLFKPVVQLSQVRQRLTLNDSLLATEADLTLFPATTITLSSEASVTPVGGDRLELSPTKATVTGGKLLSSLDLGGLSFDIPVQQLLSRLSDRFSTFASGLYLDTYYVDDNLRISRSNKGFLFIYTRLD